MNEREIDGRGRRYFWRIDDWTKKNGIGFNNDDFSPIYASNIRN